MSQNFQEIIGYSLFFPTWIKFISLSLVGTDNDMWNTIQNNKHEEENLKMKKWKKDTINILPKSVRVSN